MTFHIVAQKCMPDKKKDMVKRPYVIYEWSIRWLKCHKKENKTSCDSPEDYQTNYTKCVMNDCPKKAEYDDWSVWSDCSLPCLKNLKQKSIRSDFFLKLTDIDGCCL